MSRNSSEYSTNKAKRRRRRSTIMCTSSRQYWSDLPTDLLETIAGKDKSLALSIRAVCNSWRRSIPSPNECFSHNPRPSPFLASFPFRFHDRVKYDLAALEVVVVALHPLDPSDTSNSKSGILKLMRERSGELRAMNPLLPRQQRVNPKGSTHEVINLSDYHVQLIRRCHVVGGRYSRHRSRRVRKVVVSGDTVCALYNHGRRGQTQNWLGFLKFGDRKWNKLKGHFQDVTVYKDKFYAVDDKWLLVTIDPLSLKVSQIVKKRDNVAVNPPKYLLVESLGDLFVVVHQNKRYYFGLHVYKVDEDGGRWMKVHDLGDRIFFVGDPECTFSLSARDLPPKLINKWNTVYYKQEEEYRRFEWNSVYYKQEEEYGRFDAFLCNLNDEKKVQLSTRADGMNIFWNLAHCRTRIN